jgi:hypothetical protein
MLMKPPECIHPSAELRRLVHNMEGSSSQRRLCVSLRNSYPWQKKSLQADNLIDLWRHDSWPILINFCDFYDLNSLINYAGFGFNQVSGFYIARGRGIFA